MTDYTNWEEFKNIPVSFEFGQVKTSIKCPNCGKEIYLDNTVVLTTYPPQYSYWCECGWSGTSYAKWSSDGARALNIKRII